MTTHTHSAVKTRSRTRPVLRVLPRIASGPLLLLLPFATQAATFSPATPQQLRDAIITANGNGENDFIDLGGLSFTLAASDGNLDGPTGLPVIQNNGSLTLRNGTIRRDPANTNSFRLLGINGGATLNLEQVTLTGGMTSGPGAGLYNNGGTVNVTASTISGNTLVGSSNSGGGIANLGGTVRVINSTISGNSGGASGIANIGATLIVTDSTINNSILSTDLGGTASLTFARSIVGDCSSFFAGGSTTFTSNGYNITGSGSCNFNGPGDITGTDPLLGPLQNNGGPTRTHALLAGSPAIDRVPAGLCAPTDQRGEPRPPGVACDAGAYELDNFFVVSSLADANDGSCDTTHCTLREAINAANATAGVPDSIGFNLPGGGTITLGSTLPVISATGGPLTIDGPTAVADAIAISGNNARRILQTAASSALSLNNLSLRNGKAANGSISTVDDGAGGGAIYADGALAISNSSFSGNVAGSGSGVGNGGGGGAIRANAALTISNSSFSSNRSGNGSGPRSGGNGGAIFADRGLTISNSTLSGNTTGGGSTGGSGGAIFSGGVLTISNSTLSGNTASNGATGGSGGAIQSAAEVTISNSTLSGNATGTGNNVAKHGNGGAIQTNSKLTLINSTLSGNTTAGTGSAIQTNVVPTLSNTLLSGAANLCAGFPAPALGNSNLATDGSCGSGVLLLGGAPTSSAALNLGPLASNGGPTQTLALQAGSVALDSGDASVCAAAPVSNLDQRGKARPQGAACDIGAFEATQGNLKAVKTASASLVLVGEPVTFTLSARNLAATTDVGGTLTDTVPAAFPIDSVTAGSSLCTRSGQTVSCLLPTLAQNGVATVSIATTAQTVGTFINTVSVKTGRDMDIDPSDDSNSATVMVEAERGTVQFKSASYTASEAGPSAQIVLTRSGGSFGEATVNLSTTDLTAFAGQDYTALANSTVTWADGDDDDKTVSVPITNDTLDEDDESLSLSLSGATGAVLGSPTTATLTIEDNDNAPTVSFAAAALSVDENVITAKSRVKLSAASSKNVTVTVSVTGGSASSGADYSLPIDSTLIIPAGDTFAELSIPVTDDLLDENDETITLLLSTPTGANASVEVPFTQIVTIVDDDATPTVSFDTSGAIYDESAGTVMIPVRLSAASGLEVRAAFTVSGSATAADYSSPTSSPLVFTPDSPSATTVNVVLSIADDMLNEDSETVIFSLGALTNALSGARPAYTATITDNDAAPTVKFSQLSRDVSEGAGTVSVDVELSALSGKSVTVNFAQSGSAGNLDFSGLTASPVTIAAGSNKATISFAILEDLLDENDETVVLSLGALTNVTPGTPASFTATIQDNDDSPSVSFDLAASSIDENAGTVTLGFSLSAPSGLPVSVPFTATGALGPKGATVSTGSPVMINAGNQTGSITLSIDDDALDEFDQLVTLTLNTPTNAGLGTRPQHALTIVDNDAEPTVKFTASSQNVGEAAGTATVPLQLSALSGKTVTVPVSFGGSANKPGDYNTAASSVTISAGQMSAGFSLSIVNDTAFESPNETILVSAGIPTNATLVNPGSQTLTIVDDDAQAVAGITVAPATDTKLTLNQHCVTATTRDSVGTLLPNIPLSFTVTGVNPATGGATTGAAGTAPFCFTGTNGGTDSIKASFMSQFGTASVTWSKRNTTLKADPVPAVIVTQGLQIRIRLSPKATLKDSTGNTPIAGRSISFKASDNSLLCTATTNASGVATCQATVANALRTILGLGYNASFSGDSSYNPSTAKGDILGLTLF
ncbi:MAG: Calx-beta domain-containing protein [Panacagrimonas sp.]